MSVGEGGLWNKDVNVKSFLESTELNQPEGKGPMKCVQDTGRVSGCRQGR